MFRSLQMKNSVNLLRIYRLMLLTLRDSVRERTVTSLRVHDICRDTSPTSIHDFSTVSRRFSAVVDTFKGVPSQETILMCVPTHFLLGDIIFTSDAQRRDASSGCLSIGNEARCKHSLQPNAALYERGEKSWAAVLVCLCVASGHPALLFTLRSAQLKGRHKGDVSFAGGKKDSSDRTVVDTALREAREELGIHITEDQVWGVLKPLRDMVRLPTILFLPIIFCYLEFLSTPVATVISYSMKNTSAVR